MKESSGGNSLLSVTQSPEVPGHHLWEDSNEHTIGLKGSIHNQLQPIKVGRHGPMLGKFGFGHLIGST